MFFGKVVTVGTTKQYEVRQYLRLRCGMPGAAVSDCGRADFLRLGDHRGLLYVAVCTKAILGKLQSI